MSLRSARVTLRKASGVNDFTGIAFMSNAPFQAAVNPQTIAKDRRVASNDAQHRSQLGSVLLQSVLREVRARVCVRLLARMRRRSSVGPHGSAYAIRTNREHSCQYSVTATPPCSQI